MACAAISDNEKLVVSESYENTVRVWAAVKGRSEDGHCLTRHVACSKCVALGGDGNLVLSRSYDNTVQVWENVEGKWDDGHRLA